VRRRIYVLNPNSSARVTGEIDTAVEPLRVPGGPTIACLTLESGPPGIQSQRDVDGVVLPLCELVRDCEARAAQEDVQACAFVIACFSDPGLAAVRETTRQPVLGIAECGMLAAMTMGQRVGVISILPASIPRHLRYFGAMGVIDRLAGDLAIGLGVTELARRDATRARMIETGRRLRDEHGADVLLMGCAGMAPYQEPLQQALGLPVVEPTRAAVGMALGRVLLALG